MENRDVGQQENMAEAAVENPAARFFCHRCTQEISPVLPDYICPRCQSGFIEELAQGTQDTSEEPEEEFNPLNQIADLWGMLHYLRTPDESLLHQSSTAEVRERASRPGPSRRARYGRIPQVPNVRRNYADDSTRTRTEGFLHLVNVLYGTGTVANTSLPEFLNLHSNPGDYAWGRGGWNAIINQLINQLDVTGPPPLPKDKINEIPTVEISQDQVDKNLQCTVCMEDFKFSEPVRRLLCDHHFHNDCIIPWLELHGTCPICRKLLNESQDSFVGSSIPETFMTARENSQNGPMSDTDDVSTARLSSVPRRFSPHQSSVYDFTDEFD